MLLHGIIVFDALIAISDKGAISLVTISFLNKNRRSVSTDCFRRTSVISGFSGHKKTRRFVRTPKGIGMADVLIKVSARAAINAIRTGNLSV